MSREDRVIEEMYTCFEKLYENKAAGPHIIVEEVLHCAKKAKIKLETLGHTVKE